MTHMTRIPHQVPITRQQVNDLGFHVGTRFRVLHGVFAGEKGIIIDIKQWALPVFGQPDEVEYMTCIDTRLNRYMNAATCCFYNPAQLEIIE